MKSSDTPERSSWAWRSLLLPRRGPQCPRDCDRACAHTVLVALRGAVRRELRVGAESGTQTGTRVPQAVAVRGVAWP